LISIYKFVVNGERDLNVVLGTFAKYISSAGFDYICNVGEYAKYFNPDTSSSVILDYSSAMVLADGTNSMVIDRFNREIAPKIEYCKEQGTRVLQHM
jgi:hypothetical protein